MSTVASDSGVATLAVATLVSRATLRWCPCRQVTVKKRNLAPMYIMNPVIYTDATILFPPACKRRANWASGWIVLLQAMRIIFF